MSIIHVNQIQTRVKSLFDDKIDLSDVNKGKIPDADLEHQFLTRSLAAYVIHVLGRTDVEIAAAAITDGGNDNGIDALHYDEREKRLYVVQSKWIRDGRGEPDNGDVKKFVAGIRDLFNQSFDRFNAKVKDKRALVNQALNDPATRYHIVLAYTGADGLAQPSARDIDDLKDEMNDTSEVVYVSVMRQKELHSSLITAVSGQPITLDITLSHWGRIENPQQGFYGQVNGAQVIDWWSRFGPLLFSRNLRGVVGDSDVNEEMKQTIETKPELFWYFNNGITLISDTVDRTMVGGADRALSTFHCVNVSVVNGAQTVSAIGKFGNPASPGFENLHVQVRIISLQGSTEGLGADVTRTNNRQNRIENRDFVSLDPEQSRLRNELAIDGIQYHLLRSEGVTRSDTSLDLVEATTALACTSGDPGLAVQLKREIGKLWEDLGKAPYRALFNPTVSGLQIWRSVQIQRQIDKAVDFLSSTLSEAGGRPYSVAIHGNRIISSLVFLGIPKSKLTDPGQDIVDVLKPESIFSRVENLYERLNEALEHEYPGSVIPTLFKNARKCKTLFEICSTW